MNWLSRTRNVLTDIRHRVKASIWRRRGSIPRTFGAHTAKWLAIRDGIAARRGGDYGFDDAGVDERVVEYPWIFDRVAALDRSGGRILDAGSILNHPRILNWWEAARFSPASIVTLVYEGRALVSNQFRYEFADLRNLPYRDEWFSIVLCISTLEHVGLDNTVYGAEGQRAENPDAEASRALRELHRVTAPGGTLLLSVPFGQAQHGEWFRVFDVASLNGLLSTTDWSLVRERYFRVTEAGWRECSQSDASSAGYYDPAFSGARITPSFVAAAEAVALVELRRA